MNQTPDPSIEGMLKRLRHLPVAKLPGQRVCTRNIWMLCLSALLIACTSAPSTPYVRMHEGHGGFGYSTESLGENLYRVDFVASARTPARTVNAFALFRAVELADSLNFPAFTVETGPIDRTVLDGDETFSIIERQVPLAAMGEFSRTGSFRQIHVATVFLPIYIESAETHDARTASKLVILRVRMHSTAPTDAAGPRAFITSDVMRRLGPRIDRSTSL